MTSYFSPPISQGASHVGMYVGNGQFINANSSGGTSYSSVEEWKNLYPFLGFRRI
ncbi:NlpC/P60 family protein [Peribacillus simplex]|uniref:NlpC/P60 family protein n=1 Tax=Peribacillus simplex TaxID=1478 RepID=UPI003D9C4C15